MLIIIIYHLVTLLDRNVKFVSIKALCRLKQISYTKNGKLNVQLKKVKYTF